MKACIARGAMQIGGSCVLVRSGTGSTIALDLGLPLESAGATESLPPAVLAADPQAVLLSHSHPDHYGLLDELPHQVPLYMGEATAAILKEAAFFTPLGLDRETRPFADRTSFQVSDFKITPFLVDHSAFDAYAFLIEADGRSLFYSGDLRAHGRKGTLFERLLGQPPPADVLVLEGTTISRPLDPSAPADEREVEERCVATFGRTEGMALACLSPQNVDRLVSAYRAALRSDRDLVLDLYAASVAAATGRDSIPRAGWDRVRVYVPHAQRIRVKRSGQFWRTEQIAASRICAEELAADPARWVTCFRTSMGPELLRAGCLAGARALWLMWPGYLKSDPTIVRWFADQKIDLEVVHASGHATLADLQRLATAFDCRVVPIHTDARQRYPELFDHAELHGDGEWWKVYADG